MRALQPPGWPAPRGYSNGIEASGRLVFVGGQIGWDPAGAFAPDLAAQVRQADIVIAAAGVPGLITADMVKPGAAVLDVGVSRTADGLRGDVADGVREVAGFVSPNPGGVGPLTRAFLLTNVVERAEQLAGQSD